jgi:hypothetical protein
MSYKTILMHCNDERRIEALLGLHVCLRSVAQDDMGDGRSS